MKADPKIIRELERLLEQWKYEVSQSDLQENTRKTYILHPNNFVRWCKDDFPLRGYKQK